MTLRARVAASLDDARVQRDRLRVRCLDRTLAEVHALIRLTWHQRRLLEAQAEGSRSRLAVQALERRLEELQRNTRICDTMGEEGSERDERTVVITTIDPDTPETDATMVRRPPRTGTPPRNHDY